MKFLASTLALLLIVCALNTEATPLGREDETALMKSSERTLAKIRVKRCGSCCCVSCCCCCGCGKRKKKRSLESLRIKHMQAILGRSDE
ncbi:hypothetical protein AB6A40_004614 [Gnathostoma spinigerum]|uniref:Hepcidin n=1 Tax=Gnathostoma spinigerum TaxID=75299 RepID=A0ABD6EE53_9BILA